MSSTQAAVCPHKTNKIQRRHFLKSSLLGAASVGLLSSERIRKTWAGAASVSSKQFTITRIDRTTCKVPFRPIPTRNMDREIPHWRYTEVCEVELQSGQTGLGETLLYYTWGTPSDENVKRAIGQNAVDLIWNDSLGAGLQIALFDAVAKTADVPVHRLLGNKVHDRTPLSWWNIDTSPEDMATECRAAHEQGYRSYKTKGRPWFDVWQQVKTAAAVVPKSFKIDMDFNDTLLDAERGIPILKDLEKYPQVDIYESPIPQGDIPGNQAIRAATRVNIAMHYGNPPPLVAFKKEVCDGFVIGGGARRVMHIGDVCEMADKPFWLQLVGTGITAAFSLHLGGVLSHATWPAVNCHQLYTHNLLTAPIKLHEGFADVPDQPGLGYELDRDAVNHFRVDKPARRPEPQRLVETAWPDGRKLYHANNGRVNFILGPAMRGKFPYYYERGVTTKLVPNDGTTKWQELYEKARKAPVLIKG